MAASKYETHMMGASRTSGPIATDLTSENGATWVEGPWRVMCEHDGRGLVDSACNVAASQ